MGLSIHVCRQQRRFSMSTREISHRELLIQGGAAMAGMAFLSSPLLSQTFPSRTGEEVVPWLDQPPSNPKPDVVANLRSWEELDSWLTPNDKFFSVGHYNKPVIDENGN
jgi:DMSO/TMAO reductase YedYZ molybdopterin-dependent catalytic subunit